ncbi:cardiolipin synthase [Chachezhania antarctica]|uniref:cardiolipin synthase n=1 Tax=Chachezhania antarctica TaxID=2340860 RepID=UPI000EABD815|nr:cardiolipin synthase [Chachezhania antarctica]|tara:strand:- start:491 stop:1906 length:1416 start_codon:yes stop_codon:yes gene_type:complete
MNFALILSSVFTLLFIASIFVAWRAVQRSRTPQGAVGWVVFLLAAPHIGLITYLFLGHHRYRHYLVSRRETQRVIEAAGAFAHLYAPAEPPEGIDTKPFETLAALGVTRGNDMRLLVDGHATFDALFAAIDAAEHYILAQFFIIHDDEIGKEFAEHLMAAAKRGVMVRLLYDPVGSHSLPDAYLDALRDAGAIVPQKKHLRKRAGRLQINYRNHRKTLIVDGRDGFTGGLNVGDEYLGRDPKFGPWRDTFVGFTGPMVQELQLVYAEDWHWATNDTLIQDLHWEPVLTDTDMTGLILPAGPADEMETGTLFCISAIVAAKKRLWIASPYFVPDTDVLSALKQAALRGVDVRVLIPDAIDHILPWLAAFATFDECREAGVQFWRYKEGFLHEKVVLVDDTMAAVGTMNADNRSYRLNFETMAVFFDPRAANAVEEMLIPDFARAEKLEKTLRQQNLKIRLGAPFARLFGPLL